jgi:hypothetical protein
MYLRFPYVRCVHYRYLLEKFAENIRRTPETENGEEDEAVEMVDTEGVPYWVDKRIIDSKWKEIFDSAGEQTKEEEEQEKEQEKHAVEFSTVDLDVSADGDGIKSRKGSAAQEESVEEIPLFRRASAWFVSEDTSERRVLLSPFSTENDSDDDDDDDDDDDSSQSGDRRDSSGLLSFFGFGEARREDGKEGEEEEDVEGLAQRLVADVVKDVMYALDPRQLEIEKLQKRIRQLELEQQDTKQMLLEQQPVQGPQAGGEAGGEAGEDMLSDLPPAPYLKPRAEREERRTTLFGEMFGALGFGDVEETIEEGREGGEGGESRESRESREDEKDDGPLQLLNQGVISQEEYEQLLAVELKAEEARAAMELHPPSPPVHDGSWKTHATGEGVGAGGLDAAADEEAAAGGVSDILLEVKCSFPNARTDHFLVGSSLVTLDHAVLSQLLTNADTTTPAVGEDQAAQDDNGGSESSSKSNSSGRSPPAVDYTGKGAMAPVTICCPVDTGGTITCRLQLVPAAAVLNEKPAVRRKSKLSNGGSILSWMGDVEEEGEEGMVEVSEVDISDDMDGYGHSVDKAVALPASQNSPSSSSWWEEGDLLGLDPHQEANRRMREEYSRRYLGRLSMAQLVQRCALRNIDRSKCESREDLVALVHKGLSQRQ